MSIGPRVSSRSNDLITRATGVLTKTPDDGYPVGPDPRPDITPVLDILTRIVRLEGELVTAVGALLLLVGLAGLGTLGPFDTHSWARSARHATLGALALVLPVAAAFRTLAWLATGDPLPDQSLGMYFEPVSLPTERLSSSADVINELSTTDPNTQWLIGVAGRGRSLLASGALTTALLGALIAVMRYVWRPRFSSSLPSVRRGITVVVLVLLLTSLLQSIAWLATGHTAPSEGLADDRSGVLTTFESGTMEGWSIQEGSAVVTDTPGGTNALRLHGVVRRTFEPFDFGQAGTLVRARAEGGVRVRVYTDGDTILSQTVEGSSSWEVPASSEITVQVAGDGSLLKSVHVRPVLDRPMQREGLSQRWSR